MVCALMRTAALSGGQQVGCYLSIRLLVTFVSRLERIDDGHSGLADSLLPSSHFREQPSNTHKRNIDNLNLDLSRALAGHLLVASDSLSVSELF